MIVSKYDVNVFPQFENSALSQKRRTLWSPLQIEQVRRENLTKYQTDYFCIFFFEIERH